MADQTKNTEITKNSKRQPSRKGKKAWRKNVDISAVDEGLESLRSEERVRGKASPKDEELFSIDTTGDAVVKKQLAKSRPLRVDQILAERSAVPAVHSKPAAAKKSAPEKSAAEQMKRLTKRKLENPSSKQPAKKKTTQVATYDVWGEETTKEEPVSDFLAHTKQQKVKAPSTMAKKPAALLHQPSVVVPHAGASYNPTEDDHKALLEQAAAIEIRKLEAQKELERQMSYRKELDDLLGELEAEERQDQEEGEEEEEDTKDEKEGGEQESKSKKDKPKTRTDRNRERRRKMHEYNYKLKQQKRALSAQLALVESIDKELKERQEQLAKMAAERQARQEEAEKAGIKRLGKHYVKEVPVEIQLQDELSETLRQLKPEGNAFTDRYASLQKRNIIEPRVPVVPSRRYKRKEYEIRSYKNFNEKQKY